MWWIFGIAAILFGASQTQTVQDVIEENSDYWTKYDSAFQKYGEIWGVDWKWLKAIALNESSLGQNERVANGDVSYDGKSWGLMQVTLSTAKTLDPMATKELLAQLEPADYSINLAAKYFSQLKAMFPPDEDRYVEWVIKSYNQGPGNTRKERNGTGGGYADEYWSRFQRNLGRVG